MAKAEYHELWTVLALLLILPTVAEASVGRCTILNFCLATRETVDFSVLVSM